MHFVFQIESRVDSLLLLEFVVVFILLFVVMHLFANLLLSTIVIATLM
jgi:hypothetical protein